jgi:hypothetical protein
MIAHPSQRDFMNASASGNTPASFSYPVMSCISTLSSMNDVTIDTALLSFSQIVSNGGLSGASVLPVHWLDFRLENGSEEINLIWQTASETNCSHFIVQRSIDALKWEDLARLEGHGNSSVIQSYTYKDESPVSKAYYRITQFDYDGSQTYSGILRADFRDVSDIAKVYPNPSNGKVLIEIINQTELRAIRVCSLTGQDLQLYLSGGYAHYEIELPKGMYYLLIEDLSGRRYMKLIVVI